MKVSRKKAEQNRTLVLDTAGSLFRQHGFDGIGIADLMKTAGLTVGGFYKNFESKEDLIAKTCSRINENTLEKWQGYAADPAIKDPYKRIGSSYLSTKNRDDLSKTCIYSTLAAEVPRHEAALKQVFNTGVRGTLDFLATLMPGDSEEEKQKQAMETLSQWVGAMILARATGNSALSDAILKTAKETTRVE
jgi:TetR/AcrR family transcriptional repressor of nem operon